jgi:rod shape-determining protein MreC
MIRLIESLWESFKEYIVLVVLLVVSLITLSFNDSSAIKQVRSVAFGSFAAVSSLFSDLINTTKIKSENERLRATNAELMLQVSKLREYAITNDELVNLLGIKDTTKYPLIPARVVSKALSTSQSTITINIGNQNNIRPGMPVINDKGLVGIVHTVAANYSIVRTLNNLDLKLTVKDERSRIDGVMKWNGESLVIIDVPKTYDVEPGDRIVTSDLSSIVSIPIPVGVVKELSKVETGIFNEVKIIPYADFSKVENVFVIGIVESKVKNELELNFYNRE